MRSRNEPIEVRVGRIGEGISGLDPRDEQYLEGPSQFLWRDRLWRVLRVQQRWIEAGAWWEGPGVRAARGDWDPDDDEFADFLPPGDGDGPGGVGARGVPADARSRVARGGSSPLLDDGAQSAWEARSADRGAARAARGVPADARSRVARGGSSPLLEYEVWRVEAASGQFFSRGVYELVQDSQQGDWLLRSVVD